MSYEELAKEEVPNAETIASIEGLENGGGTLFNGSTEDLFAELMEPVDWDSFVIPTGRSVEEIDEYIREMRDNDRL